MPLFDDITGKRYGRLIAIQRVGTKWEFLCDCGKTKLVVASNVKRGHTQSCGCFHRESSIRNGKANRKHGFVGKSEYRTFQSMHQRCGNSNDKDYAKYGGRGILVCDRWSNFNFFIEDMGRKPTARHSLERMDVNKGYNPENCRWATAREQSYNKRNNIRITAFGKTGCLAEFVPTYSSHYTAVKRRLKAGVQISDALIEICGIHC